MNSLAFAVWFFLPAAISNMAPIFAAAIPSLRRFDAPLDGGRTWRGRPIMGSHKTWRGLVSGIILATIILALEQLAFKHFGWARMISGGINYEHLPTLILGPLFGIGALGGDAIESLVKRQVGRDSGKSWVPFDQIDYVIGGLLASRLVVALSLAQYALILVVYFVLHLLASYVGWLVGLKKDPI